MSHNEKYDYAGHKYWFIVMTCVFINFDVIHESTFDSQIRAITGVKWSLGFEYVISELIDWRIIDIIRIKFKWSFRISKKMLPF